MSTSAQSRRELAERIFRELDPRLQKVPPFSLSPFDRLRVNSVEGCSHSSIVLAGHRAAGKTRILPLVAELLNRPPIDLDQEIEKQTGQSPKALLTKNPGAFRTEERRVFAQLPKNAVIAVGGGFLSHHADLLTDREVVLVPITFPTYRERLLADTTRPRLRPELTLEEEINVTWTAREHAHRTVRTVPLADFLADAIGRL